VHLIDAGQQFIKSNPVASGIGARDGIVEYSIFEFTTTARDDYPKAIDVHGGANWTIRHNLFRNLQAPSGQLIGPAVLVWRGSSGTTTEGNTFLNCGRGIMYGAEDAPGVAHRGGVIRNNFFYRSPSQPGDVGIQVADSVDTQILHNTVILSGTYNAAIEYRYRGTTGMRHREQPRRCGDPGAEGASAGVTGKRRQGDSGDVRWSGKRRSASASDCVAGDRSRGDSAQCQHRLGRRHPSSRFGS
jgi:hypothetical protein